MDIRLLSQKTPNPNALKFILNIDVRRGGKATFEHDGTDPLVPLAKKLMGLSGVMQVHFFENTITVTQDGSRPWQDLDGEVEEVLCDELETHDPNFVLPEDIIKVHTSPDLVEIEQILDESIRPALQADGGDIELLKLDGDVLSVRYQGACGSCPSSMYGTLQAIESTLRDRFRPTLEVVIA